VRLAAETSLWESVLIGANRWIEIPRGETGEIGGWKKEKKSPAQSAIIGENRWRMIPRREVGEIAGWKKEMGPRPSV